MIKVSKVNIALLKEMENTGMLKQYDLSPETREAHDYMVTKIRTGNFTSTEKVTLYQVLDNQFGKFSTY